MEFLKKAWKYLVGAACVVIASGIFISIAVAGNQPIINLHEPSTYVMDSETIFTLDASVSIPDFTGDSAALAATNLVWQTDNNQIIGFASNPGLTAFDNSTATGLSVTAKTIKAGRTRISAKFYYQTEDGDENGKVIDTVFTPGNESSFHFIEVEFNDSFTTNFTAAFNPPSAFEEGRIYRPGIQLNMNANTYTQDPLGIAKSNEVVSWHQNTFEKGYIQVDKGGACDVYIRPQSGYDTASQSYIPNLYRHIVIYGAVMFDDDTYVMPTNDYRAQPIPSNIDTSASARVVYESTNPNVAVMNKSVLTPVGAGVATITAGVKDSSGNYMTYNNGDPSSTVNSYDTIDVTIPLVWIVNGVASRDLSQNINVGDSYEFLTNATADSTLTFTSSNNAVATISADGILNAKTSGTTTVTAKVTNGSFTDTITATINVVDTFALSATSYTVQVGETYTLEAKGAAEGAVIKFYIDDVEVSAANGGLTGEVDPTNDRFVTVKGVRQGSYTVRAEMKYNNVIKNAYCTVIVMTPVTDVTINPDKLTMKVGETANLRVTIGPNTAFNKNVFWVSSDPSVVSIQAGSESELTTTITAMKGGVATITVVSAADGTKYATCTVNVSEAVTGVKLNEHNVTVNSKQMTQYLLTATVYPESTGVPDGVDRTVKWSSTDESVLTVDPNTGLVTFVAPGHAAVIVQTVDGGFTDSCNFTVSVPVETVTIQSDDLILSIGERVALTAEVLPLTASNRNVEWISSDTSIVTIDTNGNLTAVKPGYATITCRAMDSGSSAPWDSINVYVRQRVSSLTLNTRSVTVTKGTVFWLYATILPETADVKLVDWKSSDESLATVDDNGMVTAIAPGVVKITATSRDTGDSDYCEVTISEPVQAIRLLTGDSQTLFVGSQFTIVPEVLPIDAPNKNVTYTSSNENVATVDENGVVTAVLGGECDIIVTTEERQLKAICHITVIEYLSTITLDKTFSYLNINSSLTLNATTTTDTATNKNIIWKSANPAIATVDSAGKVTGISYGTVVITAVAEDGGGATATCVIQVVEPVTSITLNATELRMIQGDTYILAATVYPATASVRNIKWESDNPSVATVDADGEVTAVSGGKCKISAVSTDGNDIRAYCIVYVTNKTNATKLTLNSSAITIKVGEGRKLTVTSIPSVITEELGWYSTDTGIVTVDQEGNILGINEGVANVVVYGKTSGVEGRCQVTVKSGMIYATGININSSEITMLTGKTRLLTARLTPLNATEPVQWFSSDTSVVVVDSNGKITTVGPGHATITAITNTTGFESNCLVHSIALSRTKLVMQQYDPFQLYVDGAASPISWRTNNPRIATVSSKGEVIGRKPGTTTITATIEGKTLSCTVTITEATKY